MDKKSAKPAEGDKIELRQDGEERFEQAIDIAIKTPAIRKEATKPSVVKREP